MKRIQKLNKIHLNKELVGTWDRFCFFEWNSWLRKLDQPCEKSGWPPVDAEKEKDKLERLPVKAVVDRRTLDRCKEEKNASTPELFIDLSQLTQTPDFENSYRTVTYHGYVLFHIMEKSDSSLKKGHDDGKTNP